MAEEISENDKTSDLDAAPTDTQQKETSKKKKKQKNKNKNKGNTDKKDSDDYKFVDDLSLLNLANDGMAELKQESFSSAANYLIERDLLQIEVKHLNAEYEMVRRFGAKVVNADKQNGSNRSNSKRNTGLAIKRSNCIVMKKHTWPVFYRNGLQMIHLVNQKNDVIDFTFEHTKDYQQIQFNFLDAVDSLDHNHIIVSLVFFSRLYCKYSLTTSCQDPFLNPQNDEPNVVKIEELDETNENMPFPDQFFKSNY